MRSPLVRSIRRLLVLGLLLGSVASGAAHENQSHLVAPIDVVIVGVGGFGPLVAATPRPVAMADAVRYVPTHGRSGRRHAREDQSRRASRR